MKIIRSLYHSLSSFYSRLFEHNKNDFWLAVFSKILSILSLRKFRYLKISRDHSSYNREIIADPSECFSVKPLEFGEQIQLVNKEIYPIGISVIESPSFINTTASLFITKSTIYLQNYHHHHSSDRTKLNSSLIIGNTSTHALLNMNIQREKVLNGVFLGGFWYTNWYHWLIEILSKIAVLKESKIDYKNASFIIPERIKKMKNHFKFLKSILPSAKFIFINDSKWVEVEKLIWIDSPVVFTPNFKGKRNDFNLKDFNFYFPLMTNYKDILYNTFIGKNLIASKKIFIARKNSVRGYNQSEIIEVATKYGFEVIYPEEFSLEEQVTIFKTARYIVGPTGAAWTNIIFCDSETKGLIWLPELARDVPTYSNLAYLSKMSLYHLYYNTEYDDWIKFKSQKEAFYLEPECFESALNKLVDD